MPLIHTIQINAVTKVGIWEITEPEAYFLENIRLQKNVTHPYKRVQHLAGRQLLRSLAPDFPVNAIQVSASGKPCLKGAAYEFSISHSENYAAVIVSQQCCVGIDVEKITPKLKRVAPKFLNEAERLHAGPSLEWYALCWSAKEAVYKWHGKKGVDFRAHIHLQPFRPRKAGTLDAVFRREGYEKPLQLHYRVSPAFVLVWVQAPT